jgi:hypothetical protein
MNDKNVVEKVYGKHAIYEVVKSVHSDYHLYKNGSYHRGAFASIREAVEAAEAEG